MIIIHLIVFILIAIVKTSFVLLGIILVPLAVGLKAYEPIVSNVNGREILVFSWKIMKPYQNYEDGIVAGDELKNSPEWIRMIYWSMIRNPANGLRYIKQMAPQPNPEKVKFYLKNGKLVITEKDNYDYWLLRQLEEKDSFWYYASQDYYANFRIEFKFLNRYWRIWLGTKIYPSSSQKIQDYQKHGIGSTFQIKEVTRFK